MMGAVQIPLKASIEQAPSWELSPPCGSCDACRERRSTDRAITYLNAHFGRTIERLDPNHPGMLRAADKLMAERDREVEKLLAGVRHCERLVMIDRGVP